MDDLIRYWLIAVNGVWIATAESWAVGVLFGRRWRFITIAIGAFLLGFAVGKLTGGWMT